MGIDVPLDLLHQDIPQHKLGVHGYVFIVNHNGYVMHHPELRSFIQGNNDILVITMIDRDPRNRRRHPRVSTASDADFKFDII